MATGTAVDAGVFVYESNLAPVAGEITAHDLEVEGRIPPELDGCYVRNGSNPDPEVFAADQRPGVDPLSRASLAYLLGDGMLHGVRLEGGRATWYRNRWIHTRQRDEGAIFVTDEGLIDLTVNPANTHVIRHAGHTLALMEIGLPTEVTSELETIGCYAFEGRLTTSMTAHPKVCPRSGELHFFGNSFLPPHLTYYRANSGGTIVHRQEIEVPGPSMMHDFAITDSRVVFMDLPVLFDLELVAGGRVPYRWNDGYGARIGVMSRLNPERGVEWRDVDPCFVFHTVNAFDDDDDLVVDVVRHPHLWRALDEPLADTALHRWRIRPGRDTVIEEQRDDRSVELPRIDDRCIGRRNRYAYAMVNRRTADGEAIMVKYDVTRGTAEEHEFPSGSGPGEAVFVPSHPGSAEDDGWLLTYVFDAARGASDLVILDAGRFASAPIATVRLPARVPSGFHGTWLPASSA